MPLKVAIYLAHVCLYHKSPLKTIKKTLSTNANAEEDIMFYNILLNSIMPWYVRYFGIKSMLPSRPTLPYYWDHNHNARLSSLSILSTGLGFLAKKGKRGERVDFLRKPSGLVIWLPAAFHPSLFLKTSQTGVFWRVKLIRKGSKTRRILSNMFKMLG